MTTRVLIGLLLIAAVPAALAGDAQPRGPGVESADYVWNAMNPEKLQALNTRGDPGQGKVAFEACQGCHRSSGAGRPDGSYPRLAGQHATVLIKQMTDIRAGYRDNWKMYPFVDSHVLTTQGIADIAAYLQNLPVAPDHGIGPGRDVARARELYDRDCRSCHGEQGLGDGPKFFPRLAGQHYEYLLRTSRAIRDGERRNSNPEMMKAVKGYSDADLEAVNDYISRLPTP